jgi:putative transposase
MIQYQLKLKLNSKQERTLKTWLWHLASVHNWAIRKIEQDAKGGIYYSRSVFQNLLAGHSDRLEIPSHTLQGQLCIAYDAWQRCFKRQAKRPRFKSKRNKLNSVSYPDPFRPVGDSRITVPGIGKVRFHKMSLPQGKIKCGRICKRASGWYLCLFIDAQPKAIPAIANGTVGIDPGFKHLLALSNGEKIEHPREFRAIEKRLAQAQRGNRRKLTARIQERAANKRKDRNHKLSRCLVAENAVIAFSKDNHRAVAKKFGKSVADSGHGQLRGFIAYKASHTDGRSYYEPDCKNSTRTCSTCGSKTGPTGLAGLSVRHWVCTGCGSPHDRDTNAAVNTLIAAVGRTVEEGRYAA